MDKSHSDNYIIQLLNARDERALTILRDFYGGYLKKIAVNVLCNPADAEEIVNDVLFAVWNDIPPTMPECFSAYLARIARNKAINMYNARHMQKRAASEYALSIDELDEILPSLGSGVDEYSDASELVRCINEFLRDCDNTKRRCFVKRYFYFDSLTEISAQEGITENKLRSILFRMRKKLKKYLEVRYE